MPGFALEKWIGPSLEETSARLRALGIGPLVLVGAAFVTGLAAVPAIATGRFWIGLVLILLSRGLAAVGGVNAGTRDAGLASAFELTFLASIPFAFALNDPASGLCASLLLFGLIAAGAASLFANDQRALAPGDVAVCVAAYAISCLRPDWFALIAYMLSLFCFVAAGVRIALAVARSSA